MTETQGITRVQRRFYGVMGLLCVLMSLAVLSKILRDLLMSESLAYGKVGLLIQHPALQTLHVIAACVVWTAVFWMGTQWLIRARTGREPAK